MDEDTVVIFDEEELAATRAAAAELAEVYAEPGCNGKGLSLAGEVVSEVWGGEFLSEVTDERVDEEDCRVWDERE